MSAFIILGIIATIVIIIGFVGYATVTTHIIKEQEKEIAELTHKLKCSERMHKALRPR
jgi:hypothetical protein